MLMLLLKRLDTRVWVEPSSAVRGIWLASSASHLNHRSWRVKCSEQKNVIQEMEMLALFISLSIWCPVWNGYRVVAFTDSEAVRHSFLKTWSKNDPCSDVLKCIFDLEENNLCPVWLERVPSQSNPADFLSRGQVTEWRSVKVTHVDVHEVWHRAVPKLG